MNSQNTKSGDYAHKSADWRTGAISGLWVGLTFIGLLAGAPARAGDLSPFAGKAAQMAGSTGADRLLNGSVRAEDQRGTQGAVSHSVSGAHVVLAPRRLASTSTRPGATGPRVLLQVSWTEAADQTADSNPFARVGNRSGLVSATHAEVRDGEVWLVDRRIVEVAEDGGSRRRAAP